MGWKSKAAPIVVLTQKMLREEGLKPNKFYYALKEVTEDYESPLYNQRFTEEAVKIFSHDKAQAIKVSRTKPLIYKPQTRVRVRKINKDVNNHCGEGIHLATSDFFRVNKYTKAKKMVLVKFKGSSAVVPLDRTQPRSKFRVASCFVVREITYRDFLQKKIKFFE